MNIYVNIAVLTKVRPDHIIKLLHTTPCYVSPRDTLTSGNNVPAANCHLTGCLLSHDGCWLGSPFTAGFGSVTRITHTSLGSVCLHFLGQTRWRSSTYGSASVLDVWHINLTASSLEKQQKAGTKNVYFSLFCSESVLRLSDLDVLRLLLWLWLRWPQTSTPLSVFLVYALVLLYFWSYWKLSACCARKPAMESFFPLTQLSSVSDGCFTSGGRFWVHICNLHSCCRGNYHKCLVCQL